VLAGKRRRSGHWLVQYGAMAAYYLPSPLTFYAAEAVYSTSHIDESTPFLVAGVLYLFELIISSIRCVLLVSCHQHESIFSPRPSTRWLQLSHEVNLPWLGIFAMGSESRFQLLVATYADGSTFLGGGVYHSI